MGRRVSRSESGQVRWGCWQALFWLFVGTQGIAAADFNVTSPGTFYAINGVSPNPVLTLVRGETYTFSIMASSVHPFRINSPAGTTSGNNTFSGMITFRVPTNAVNYRYQCSIHDFGNTTL